MKAEELRIGNLVYDHNNVPRKIAYVGDCIGVDLEDGATQKYDPDPIYSPNLNLLTPIPLTEEWLKKLGFRQFKKLTRWWDLDGFPIADKEFDNYYYFVWTSIASNENLEIKHVHQLQNLYFALTGKEL